MFGQYFGWCFVLERGLISLLGTGLVPALWCVLEVLDRCEWCEAGAKFAAGILQVASDIGMSLNGTANS